MFGNDFILNAELAYRVIISIMWWTNLSVTMIREETVPRTNTEANVRVLVNWFRTGHRGVDEGSRS